jgi:hypothetical protein
MTAMHLLLGPISFLLRERATSVDIYTLLKHNGAFIDYHWKLQ